MCIMMVEYASNLSPLALFKNLKFKVARRCRRGKSALISAFACTCHVPAASNCARFMLSRKGEIILRILNKPANFEVF